MAEGVEIEFSELTQSNTLLLLYDNLGATESKSNTTDPVTGELIKFDSCVDIGADIWYGWTPEHTSLAVVSLCGATFDTVLAVYDDPDLGPGEPYPSRMRLRECDDDTCGFASQVTVRVREGERILIRVGGLEGDRGRGFIRISQNFCFRNEDCDNGNLCDGTDFCTRGLCEQGEPPCPDPDRCNRRTGECLDCAEDANCDDGLECTEDTCESGGCLARDTCSDGDACNGIEFCGEDGTCQSKPEPCPNTRFCESVDESTANCFDCEDDSDCDDGDPLTVDRCRNRSCGCVADGDCLDDGLFCNGSEECDLEAKQCVSPGDPCAAFGFVCFEPDNRCLLP